MRTFILAVVAGLALGGCATELEVRPLRANDSNRAGVSYVLPFTQYTVTQTWRVADCTAGQERLALKVEASSGQADDGAHAYLIDPANLQRLLSISEFNATYQDGSNMLRTVNASVEDRTGQFIGNIVQTVASLAPVAMGLPAPGSTPPPPGTSICRPEVIAALSRSTTLKGQLDDANAQVTRANDEVLAAAAIAAQMGTSIDTATRDRLGAATRRLHDLRGVQSGLAAQLSDALRPITYQRIVRWPESSACFQSLPHGVDQEALGRWFLEGATLPTAPEVHLAIERAGSFGRVPVSGADCPGVAPPATPDPAVPDNTAYVDPSATLQGLRYRIPAQGRLVACNRAPCRSSDHAAVLAVVEGPVAQLGFVNVLPVRTEPFGSNSFTAEFRPGGGLQSAGYAQRSAPLEGASAAVASAAGTLGPLLDPTARLTRQTAYLEALQQQRDALVALQPAANDPADTARQALAADTTLLNAQISNLQAQITLRELQTRLQQP